jgi:hypothetical protein
MKIFFADTCADFSAEVSKAFNFKKGGRKMLRILYECIINSFLKIFKISK